MKKTLLSIFTVFLLTNSLFADDLSDFLDHQYKFYQEVQSEVNSSRISLMAKEKDDYISNFFRSFGGKIQFYSSYDFPNNRELINTLKNRIRINNSRSNSIAVSRDEIEVIKLITEEHIYETLKLLSIALVYGDKEIIINQLKANREYLNKDQLLNYSKIFNRDRENQGDVYNAGIKNLDEAEMSRDILEDISSFIENNMPKFFRDFMLFEELIFAINSSNIGIFVNKYLSFLNLNLAHFSLSLVFLTFIIIFRKFFSTTIDFVFSKTDLTKNLIAKIFLRKIKKPLEAIIVILGFQLVLYTLFSDFILPQFIINFFPIIYTVIIAYVLFDVINTVAAEKIEDIEKKAENVRKELINLVIKTSKALVVMVSLLIVLNIFGFNLTAILSTLGIGGLAVALAAKDTLSNFFGFISIISDNSFTQGDWIEVDGVEGTVVEIGLRSTTIRTFDNSMITMPNAKIVDGHIKNWNKRKIGRRIKMHVGVTYQSNIKDIKNAIIDIREMLSTHPGIATDRTQFLEKQTRSLIVSKEDLRGVKRNLLVYLDQYSNSSIDILVYCFSRSVIWSEWLEVKEDILFKIADILNKNNLEFAYPTMVNYIKKEGD